MHLDSCVSFPSVVHFSGEALACTDILSVVYCILSIVVFDSTKYKCVYYCGFVVVFCLVVAVCMVSFFVSLSANQILAGGCSVGFKK